MALWVLFFSVFALMLIALRMSVLPDAEEVSDSAPQEIAFATPAGFYTESLSVFLSGTENCEVYYSLGGIVPESTTLKGTIRRYSKEAGISLRAYAGQIKYYSLTARAYYPDTDSWGDPVCSTYVVGEEADTRFTTMAVFITCDPDKLFGYEEGILILGKTRDD